MNQGLLTGEKTVAVRKLLEAYNKRKQPPFTIFPKVRLFI